MEFLTTQKLMIPFWNFDKKLRKIPCTMSYILSAKMKIVNFEKKVSCLAIQVSTPVLRGSIGVNNTNIVHILRDQGE